MSPESDPTRILIIRPSALGDVCRSVPVLVSLRRAYPSARIDWLVQDTFAPVIEHHPDLSNVVAFPRARLGRWYAPAVAPEAKRFLASLGEAGYDLVLDCQGLLRSGLFALATHAPRRIGFDNAQELGWLGLTERVEAPRSMHAVDRMLRLAEAAGAPPVYDLRLFTSPRDRAALERHGLANCRFAVIAPTSRWPGKVWPQDRFVELTRRLLAGESGFAIESVAIVGSSGEREQCAALLNAARSDSRVIDLVGKTSIGELMAVVEASTLLVGCDSAAVHMGVGFARPMAALYGPTRVDRVGPFGRAGHVVQRLIPGDVMNHKDEAAGRVLMHRIQVDDVIDCLTAQAPGARTATQTAHERADSPRRS